MQTSSLCHGVTIGSILPPWKNMNSSNTWGVSANNYLSNAMPVRRFENRKFAVAVTINDDSLEPTPELPHFCFFVFF